jgi:regulatory protein
MAGRRARTGRGWDAAPARPRAARQRAAAESWESAEPRARKDEPTDPGERAREICLRLLAVRPRTRTELATALRQRGVGDEVAAEVLQRYGEVGIIDDTAFARAWVSSRHHGRGLARRALAAELRQKGVDSETVGVALEELDPGTEAATARALVDRKLRTERGPASEALLRRLVGMLARKGYAPGLAIRIVRDALAAWPGADGAEGADGDLDLVAEALESEASLPDADR